jgi:hypothetical protein
MKSSNKGLYLSVPTPCQENWDNMNSTGDSKYCIRCKKNIIDFSAMSDIEVLAVIKNSRGELCGRFYNTQLNRLLTEPASKHSKLLPVAVASAIMAITFTEGTAQVRKLEQAAMAQFPVKVQCQLPEVIVRGSEMPPRRFTVGSLTVVKIEKSGFDPMYYSGKSIKARKKKN